MSAVEGWPSLDCKVTAALAAFSSRLVNPILLEVLGCCLVEFLDLEDGISVRFDEELGRLFFAGGGMTEETCEQLLENVEFMTTDSDAAKGVTVRMKNSVDEVDKFSQLLL